MRRGRSEWRAEVDAQPFDIAGHGALHYRLRPTAAPRPSAPPAGAGRRRDRVGPIQQHQAAFDQVLQAATPLVPQHAAHEPQRQVGVGQVAAVRCLRVAGAVPAQASPRSACHTVATRQPPATSSAAAAPPAATARPPPPPASGETLATRNHAVARLLLHRQLQPVQHQSRRFLRQRTTGRELAANDGHDRHCPDHRVMCRICRRVIEAVWPTEVLGNGRTPQ